MFLRILSNLTDRALARAQMVIPVNNLEGKGYSGAEVRDGIILANDLATVDPYRAATHNKGIMNGVDAVALATGNDWRAIEAAAHAYAARNGRYASLTRWYKNERGDLVGEVEMPMKVGTVGGSLETNPTVRINHRLLGSPDARELASIMAAVGLAQNFAALRALSTDGIQQGHMTLHARSVATTAGVPEQLFESVVEALIESGEIKVWKAKELVRTLNEHLSPQPGSEPRSFANGKVILLGEHAVVYGRHAIAAPIPLAVEVRVLEAADGVRLLIPRWGVEQRIKAVEEHQQGAAGILAMLLRELALDDRSIDIEVFPHIPRAMGLGGSAALAVAIVRVAGPPRFGLGLSLERVNALAFECEKAAHGTPSGVDNTVATYGQMLLYSNASRPRFSTLAPSVPLPIVIGISGKESLTANNVAQVRAAWQRQPARYEAVFDQIDRLALAGVDALAARRPRRTRRADEPESRPAQRAAAVHAGARRNDPCGAPRRCRRRQAHRRRWRRFDDRAVSVQCRGRRSGDRVGRLSDADVHRRRAGGRVKRHASRNLVVSSEEERLILVDSDDRETGTSSKSECHDGAGILHRAFSLFVFNRAGELLIHQRHPAKRLWPRLLVEQLLQPSARRRSGGNRDPPPPRAGTRLERGSRVRLQVRIHRPLRRRRNRT